MARPASAYPRLSQSGRRLVAGDDVVVLDRSIEIGKGIGGQFEDELSIVYGSHDGKLMRWKNGVVSVVREQGFNAFAVAGERWLGWRPDTGLVWHDNVVWTEWHSPALSETRWAAIIGTTLVAGLGDGDAGQIVAGPARDPRLVGNLLTWVQDEAGGAMSVWGQRSHGGPVVRLSVPGNTKQGYIVPVLVDGQPWALTHDDTRVTLYPWADTSHGFVVARAPAHRPDGRQLPEGFVRIVYDAEHNVLGDALIDLRTEPRVDLRAAVPQEPVLDMTSVVDVLDYLPMGKALDGSHLLAMRYTGQQPNVFSIAKHPDGGGEWWAHDDQWVYHHLDQAASSIAEVASGRFVPRFGPDGSRIDAYYLADDARIMPRRVKTGDTTIVNGRIYRIADGHSDPWHHENKIEVFSSFPTPIGSGRAMRWTYDNRTARDPNGRLKGRYEKFIYAIVNGRRYSRWEDWRTKDDNSGDELMQHTEFQEIDVAPAIAWRLSPRPKTAPLLPTPSQRINMTIIEPAADKFPYAATDGRVRCVCAPDGGGWAPWVEWIHRRVGESTWHQWKERRNPRDDDDNTFDLGPGDHEIGLRWEGGQTGRQRIVRVAAPAPTPEPPMPTPDPNVERIVIRTNDGYWVQTNPGDQGRVIATTQSKSEATVFVKELVGDKVAIKDEARGMYVRAFGGGGSFLLADATVPQGHELHVEGDAEFGRSLKTPSGHYWSAIGGGGSSVDAVAKQALSWESFTFDRALGGGPRPPTGSVLGYLPPAGQMRMVDWCMADDHGPRSILSATLMDGITQFVRDRSRLDRNLAYGMSHGVDMFRALGEVDWPGAEFIPRAVDRCVEFLRYTLDKGTRVELTLFGSHSHISESDSERWTRDVCRAIRDAGLEVALGLVEVINEAGGARWSVDRCLRHARIVREFLGTVPLATSAPYQDGAGTTTGWHENEDGARAYLRFGEHPANILTPHFDRGTNGAEGEYRICRQPYIAAILGRPFGNNEGAGPGASAQGHDVMRDPTMQRVHANGTWLQKGAFHCWHTNAGVGLNTDSLLEGEPGLPWLSAVRAILPGDIANFTIKNWHWGDNPVESLRGVRDGNRQAPVRTHGLVNGWRVVIHVLGNDFGAELRARSAMRLTRHSWDGTQYAAAEELEVRGGQVFYAPEAPDQIYVGRFI